MGNEQPLVSIVTPLYNAERFIEEMIDSVIGQTYSNWELIIIDDASTDRSFELVKAKVRNELRIRLYQFQENKGAAAARNKGIQQAKGKYLAFLDSDDLWLPTKLEKQVDFMEQGEKVFSFTSYYVLKENMNSHKKLVSAPAEVTYELLLKNTIIGCLTVMLNIEKLGKVQMPTIRTRQDFVLWLQILKQGHKAYGMAEGLACYRKVSNSISSNKLKAAKRNWMVYRDFEKLSFIKTCYVFVNYAWNGLKKI